MLAVVPAVNVCVVCYVQYSSFIVHQNTHRHCRLTGQMNGSAVSCVDHMHTFCISNLVLTVAVITDELDVSLVLVTNTSVSEVHELIYYGQSVKKLGHIQSLHHYAHLLVD